MKFIRPIILFLCIVILFPYTVNAENDKKVVLIVINELNLKEFYSIPVLREMMEQGSIGLMNTRTSTRANTYKAYTTIGAGTRAEASSDSLNFLTINDEVQEIYYRRTGLVLPQSGLVNLDMVRLKNQNENGDYGAKPGTLGQALQNKGKKTAVLGNADTDEIPIRLGSAIAMDNNGYVNYGLIDSTILAKDYNYPFGLKSNYLKMMETFETYLERSDFVVIDIGDISRLERYKPNLSEEQYIRVKGIILNDINEFVKKVINALDLNSSRIMVVSPYPASSDIIEGKNLTPVLVYGEGVNSNGTLYSDTTRRNGIIGNIDVAPSILDYLGIESKSMQGKPLDYIKATDNYHYLINMEKQVVNISNYRSPVLSTFAIFEILVSALSMVILLFRERIKVKIINIVKIVLLSTMIVPMVLLIAPLYKFSNLLAIYVLVTMTLIILSLIIGKMFQQLDAILIISGITTFFILIDIGINATFMKQSVLGYDPIIGARYYGIGNEYMGVLIGSTLVFATGLLDRFKISRKITIALLCITIIMIGLPKLGANVGGTISAVAAFTYTVLRLYKVPIRPKQILLVSFVVIIVVSIMAFIDINFMKNQSHLAGAIQSIINEGPSSIYLIINRKISMNLRLIGVTIWSKVLITTIVIIGVLFYRPVKMISKLTYHYPNLTIGWTGIVAGCIIAFAVNDSGIVAAATSIIFLATSLLYLSLSLVKD